MKKSKYKIYSSTKDAWDAMYSAISNAKQSIYWELYIFIDDDAGKRFFDKLEEKAKEGIDVKLVVDAFGSIKLSKKRAHSLKESGAEIIFFNERKKRYRGWWKMVYRRSHRKILIVDETVGFIGGVNIREDMEHWSDIMLRIEGKSVHSLLRAFAKMYIISGGNKKKVKHLLKYKFRVRSDIKDLEFVYDDPDKKRSKSRKIYAEALLKARERVILFSPYYFPDKKFFKAVFAARKRGVKVDLLIPFRSDVRIATYATYAWFSLMKKFGVNIHMTQNMMHGKGVIVDDEWAMVGSSNIDRMSFYDNYEANVKIKNKKQVRKIKNILRGWIKRSKKVDGKQWNKRGIFERLKEWFSSSLFRWWSGRE